MKKKWYQFWQRNNEQSKPKGYFEMLNESESDILGWYNIGTNNQDTEIRSPELAMKVATVYRCVDILSGSIASLPLHYKVKRDNVFKIYEHPTLSYLLQIKANERQSSFDMWQNAIIQMVMQGNAYIYPKYSYSGLEELILLTPNSCTYDVGNNLYLINDPINLINENVDSDEIIHLKNISLDGGYMGVSTIAYAAKVLGISSSADGRTLDSFKKGSTLKGFISGDESAGTKGFGELQSKQLQDINTRVSSEINSGKNIFSIPGQAKFNQLSMSSTDLQLLDTRKFGVLDICRFFGVHPDKVFAGQSQNYKASAMSNEMFLSDTLLSRLRRNECELNAKLIPKAYAFKHKIEYDVEALLTTSLEQESAYMEKTIQNGVYTTNYWRAKKGQSAVEGGDEVMISCNVAPINSAKIKGEQNNLPPKTGNNTNK